MEKIINAPKHPTDGFQVFFETDHYAAIKTILPKGNSDTPSLACFAIVDKDNGVVWGARTGLGGAAVACCVAEGEYVQGLALATAQKARGFHADAEGGSGENGNAAGGGAPVFPGLQ